MGHPTGIRVIQYPSPQRAGRWKPALATLSPAPPAKPKLLDRLREALRSRHYSRRTEQTYCLWIKRFIYFHHVRHPSEMAEPEINAFLTYLAVNQKMARREASAPSALRIATRFLSGASRRPSRGCSGRSSTRARSRVRAPLIRNAVMRTRG